MAIDPPSSSYPPANKILVSQRDAQLSALKVESGIRIQGTADALIKQITPLSAHQRRVLFNSPATENETAQKFSAGDQKSLANNLKPLAVSSRLYLAELEFKNLQQLVVTNKALTVGDYISVKLLANNQLQIVDSITKGNAASGLLNQSDMSQARTTQQLKQDQMSVVVNSLKEALPKQSSSSDLISLAAKVSSLPKSILDKLFSAEQKSLLKELSQLARTPDQLKNPHTLKRALSNSGIFFENKINQYLKARQDLSIKGQVRSSGNPDIAPLKTLIKPLRSSVQAASDTNNKLSNQLRGYIINKNTRAGSINSNLQKTITKGQQAIPANSKAINQQFVANQKTNTADPLPSSKNINEDIKSVSLLAKEILNNLSLGLETALTKNINSQLHKGNSSNLEKLLKPFLQNILSDHSSETEGKKNITNRTSHELQQQLVTQLRNNVNASLARLQVLQTQSLLSKVSSSDANQTITPQIHIEIPVQYQSSVHQVGIDIEEDWVPKEDSNSKEEESKSKRWTVMLSFKLPEKGEFYAKLRAIEETVSVQFWADKIETLNLAENNIAHLYRDLSSQGVRVEEIQCVAGKPPTKKIKLEYSLVDIRT